MHFFKGFVAAAACLIALPATAVAQVNDQSADEIRRAIKVWIGQNVQGVSGIQSIELDDRIRVVPDNGMYRVSLPGGRAILQGEGTLHFGEIEIDLAPLDNGWYDANWQLPDSYRMEPQFGSDLLVTIGGQSAQGVFAPEYQTMMAFDGDLRDITVSEVGGDVSLTIDRISGAARSTEVSDDVYDTEATYRLDRLEVSGRDGELFRLSDVQIVASADDARLAAIAEFLRLSNTLSAEINESSDIDQVLGQFGEIADLMESMPTLFAGMSFEASHGAIRVLDHGDEVTVNDGRFSMSLEGLDQALSQFVIATSSDGIDTNDPEIAGLLPNEVQFRLAMVDLPSSELAALGVGTMRSMGTTDPEVAMLMAAGNLQNTLMSAGSTLEIGPIRLASDIASIDLEGELRPDTSSPFSVVGEIDMVATGLDALIAEIQNSGANSGDAQEAVQFLTLLQTLGAQAPDADGRSVRTYAFRLDASGTMLLNGADIMPLITGMQ